MNRKSVAYQSATIHNVCAPESSHQVIARALSDKVTCRGRALRQWVDKAVSSNAWRPSRRTLLLGAIGALGPSLCTGACARRGLVAPTLAPISKQPTSSDGNVTARFLGTTSILFQDRDTKILSDGFVTRPERRDVFVGKIEPNEESIASALTRLGADRIDAIFTGHSHYDHALDAPTIAKRTGAVLLGSESTRQIGVGAKLPCDQIRVVRHGETCRFGKFELTFLESKHSAPELWRGTIDEPLVTPAPARRWKTGTTWSVLVQHEKRTLLMHGSANYRRGALHGRRADVVYLGIGSLGLRSGRFVRRYWNEVVRATGAKRVVLVHWDDFFGIEEPLRPGPAFARATEHIRRQASATCVEVLLPTMWEPTDPFQGLPPP